MNILICLFLILLFINNLNAQEITIDTSIEDQFIQAVAKSNLEEIKTIHDNGFNISFQISNGWTPLMFAITRNQIASVELLIKLGANVNIQENDGFTAVMFAIAINNVNITNLLLGVSNVNLLIRNKHGKNAIEFALAINQKVIAKTLASSGLTRSLVTQNIEDILYYIESGASVNTKLGNGWTPLLIACANKNIELAKKLIQNPDINVNLAENDGWTPSLIAVHRQDIEMIQLLLDNKADFNVRNNRGVSAYDLSRQINNSLISILLERANEANLRSLNQNLHSAATVEVLETKSTPAKVESSVVPETKSTPAKVESSEVSKTKLTPTKVESSVVPETKSTPAKVESSIQSESSYIISYVDIVLKKVSLAINKLVNEPEYYISNIDQTINWFSNLVVEHQITVILIGICLFLFIFSFGLTLKPSYELIQTWLPHPTTNKMKYQFELYALQYSRIWISIFMIVIMYKLYEDFDLYSYLWLCIPLALVYLLQPIVFPLPAEKSLAWYERYSMKANVWIAIFSFIGNYWYTHYFYSVLNAKYTFPSHRLNDVPIALYFATHFYFMTYHTISNIILRRIETRYLPGYMRSIFFWLSILAFSYFTAFMETLTISSFPYYSFDDRNMAYIIGSAFYGIYFMVSFPVFYRIDEVNDNKSGIINTPHTMYQTILEALGVSMLVLILLDICRLYCGIELNISSVGYYIYSSLTTKNS